MNGPLILVFFVFVLKMNVLYMNSFLWVLFIELLMMIMFLMMFYIGWVSSMFMIFMFLFIVVIEGSIALSVVSKKTHSDGSDLMNL